MADAVLWVVAAAAACFSWAPAASSSLESTECELTTGRTLTVIKSVRFPEPYGPNVDCRYAIRRRSDTTCSVTFLFNVLDVDPSPDCSSDYILFEDTGEKICGAKPVGFSRSLTFEDSSKSRKELVMSFHSSNQTRGGLGYMVTVVQQSCPKPSCDVDSNKMEFTLQSPNFPMPYDNEHFCRYIIRKETPKTCRLSLTVNKFELEEDEHCEADFLKLQDGTKLCGALQPGQIVEINFLNDTMTLEFQSDHVITKDGFQLHVHQIECPESHLEEKLNIAATKAENLTTASVITTEMPEEIPTPIP